MKRTLSYLGSKLSLVDFIENSISEYVDLKDSTFADLFSGSGTVSRFFKPKVKKIIANDLEYYSYVLNKTLLSNQTISKDVLKHLNAIALINDSFIFNQFSENGSENRLYFSEHNGKKIDSVRLEIEKLYFDKVISENEYYYYLTSLLMGLDKVANTTSVYGAFLKKLKSSAEKEILLEDIDIDYIKGQDNDVYQEDANKLIGKIKGDILYLDPPYNTRQYSANYHVLNTILKYNTFNIPRGKTGLTSYNKSAYSLSNVKDVKLSLESLIRKADFKYVFISYNNEGTLKLKDFQDVLSKYGEFHVHEKDYKTYKADSKRNNKSESTIEYLLVLIKK